MKSKSDNLVESRVMVELQNLEEIGGVDTREEYIAIMQRIRRYCEASIESCQNVLIEERADRMKAGKGGL